MPRSDQRREQYRLQHFLALCGYASRRHSEKAIVDGIVTVDGAKAHLGQKVFITQDVRVNGVGIRWRRAQRDDSYYIFHKPSRTLSSHNDDTGQNRRLVYDSFGEVDSKRLFSLGRLDYMTSGALLITSDGAFAQAINHPSHKIEKEYQIIAKRVIPDELLEQFVKGVYYNKVKYKAKSYTRISDHTVNLVLVEGKNRELRNVFFSFKVPVKKIHRVRIGPITLRGLALGTFRKLNAREIKFLTQHTDHVNSNDSKRDDHAE